MSNITPEQYRELQLREMLRTSQGRPSAMQQSAEPIQRESELHAEILEYCKSKGYIAFHGSMAHRAMRTLSEPDFVVATDDGRTIYAEAKRPGQKPTPAQQAMLHWLERNKQTVGIVHSLDEFIALAGKEKV